MKSVFVSIPLFGVIGIVLPGCSASSSSDPFVKVEDSDVEMNAAMGAARNTFQQFFDNWQTFPNDGVSIKFGIPKRDDSIEYIWFNPSKITDTEITGSCGNDPVDIAGLKFGDVGTLKRSEVSDWMILAANKCFGGCAIRVLAKMEPENAPPFRFVDFQSP